MKIIYMFKINVLLYAVLTSLETFFFHTFMKGTYSLMWIPNHIAKELSVARNVTF